MNTAPTLQRILSPFVYIRQHHPLLSFIVIRVLSMFALLFVLGFAVFGLMALAPGDIVDQYVQARMLSQGDGKGGTSDKPQYDQDLIAAQKHELGLDQPFYIQYFNWLKQVIVHHDLGRSMLSKAPIIFLIGDRLRNSLTLNLISFFFLTSISFTLGIYFSSKVGTRTDFAASFIALFLHSFPGLLLLLLLQLFASVSGLFPITAYPDFNPEGARTQFAFSYLYHIILPLLGALLGSVGGTMRMIRALMLDQLGQPYITALRARGLSEKRVYLAHAFRNTLNPFITGSANLLASLFSGSLILEVIFSYPGIGRLMYEAVLQEDINLVLANIMFISFLVLLGMLIADILLAIVDPRIRYSGNV